MKFITILLLLMPFVESFAQPLPLKFSCNSRVQSNYCQDGVIDIHSIAYDSKGNYYFTFNRGYKYNIIQAVNINGQTIWRDSVYNASSEAVSFVVINDWDEALWFHIKSIDYVNTCFLNLYQTDGTLISSNKLIDGKTLITNVIPFNNNYLITGCSGEYNTAEQKYMPMLMFSALVDRNGHLLNLLRMPAKPNAYTSEPIQTITIGQSVYMAGYYLTSYQTGNNTYYHQYPAIMHRQMNNDSYQLMIDSINPSFRYITIVPQSENLYAIKLSQDFTNKIIIDVLDESINIIKQKEIKLMDAFVIDNIKANIINDSLFIVAPYYPTDSIFLISADLSLNSSHIRKISIKKSSPTQISNIFWTQSKSFNYYYIDSCHEKNSLMVKTIQLPDLKSDSMCLEISDSSINVVFVQEGNEELLVGALEKYACRKNTPIKYSSVAARISHYSNKSLSPVSEQLIIFPNPSDNVSIIRLPDIMSRMVHLNVYQLDGKSIYPEYSITDGSIKINTARFANGMYLIQVLNNEKVYYSKLIVQH